MRIGLLGVLLVGACGGASGGSATTSAAASSDGSGSSSGAAGSTAASSSSSSNTSAGASSGGPTPGSSGASSTSSGGVRSGPTAADAGSLPATGNPDGQCTTLALPSEAQLADTSNPTTVVGSGTPESCTFDSLNAAVTKGGIITFDCGPTVVTIPITATLVPPTTNAYANQTPLHIVIDGGNKIILDGQQQVQLISWVHASSFQVNSDTLTLQNIRLINGKTTPTEAIPACPAANGISNATCSTGYDDGMGGAIHMQDGSLRIINCSFAGNQAALLGPDTGGGAIYLEGALNSSYIINSTFENNTASNAGAIGMLWATAFIANSLFDGNSAVGIGANNNQPADCTCMNNGQNQTGSGGNGGAIYKDGGDGLTLTVCGDEIRNNSANEFGAAIFLTADGSKAKLVIDDSKIEDNPSPISYWNWCVGVSTDNPHASGSTTCSPAPINTTFCDTTGTCSSTCSS